MLFRRKKVDFTEGRILPKLLTFTIPIVITSLLQMLYNAADMMVVSLSSEPNAVGAVGSAGPFVSLIVNLYIGFSVGSNVTIARHVGAKDRYNARRATHTAVTLALIFGFACMAIGLIFSRQVLTWMGISTGAFDLALKYVRIYLVGLPFISLTNFLVSISRAKGDSTTPMMVLACTGLINVALNFVMVLGLGLSVEGVAIATVGANVVSSLVMFFKLRQGDEYTSISPKELCLDRKATRDIIYIGLPSAIQGSFISISNIVLQSSVATVDKLLTPDPTLTPVLNGNAAAANLDNFIYLGMNSVYQGIMSFTGQNFGAGKLDRIKRGFFTGLVTAFCVGITLAGIMIIFRAPLLSLYGIVNGAEGTADAVAYRVAIERGYCIAIPYFLCGFMEVSNGVMRGLGRSLPPFLIAFFGLCVFRIAWNLIVVPMYNTAVSIYIGNPITWLITSAIGITLSLVYIKNEKKKQQLAAEAAAETV